MCRKHGLAIRSRIKAVAEIELKRRLESRPLTGHGQTFRRLSCKGHVSRALDFNQAERDPIPVGRVINVRSDDWVDGATGQVGKSQALKRQ